VKEQFHINESDIHKVQKFEHEIENLIDVYDEITTEMRKTTARYSEVLDNLEYIKGNIGAINDEQKQIQEYLITHREDEAEARENALLVQDRKEDIYRELMGSNMSSVPEKFLVMKNELDIDVKEIHKYFERRPLNVQYIKDKVNHTVLLLNKFDQEAYEILQEARLTELMIQYGNRYRRDDHDFNTMLNEAERLFKENRYKRALEIAKNGLEKVEPGAAARIEKEFDNESPTAAWGIYIPGHFYVRSGILIYMDNAATTRPFEEALETFEQVNRNFYYNTASIHPEGRKAGQLLEASRKQVLELLDLGGHKCVFTSGATESNNIAIQGVLRKKKQFGRTVLASEIEHPSVINVVEEMKDE